MGDGGNNACGSSMAGGEVNVKLTSSSKARSHFTNFTINLTLVTIYSLFTKFCYLPFENLEAKILLTNFAVFCQRTWLCLCDNEMNNDNDNEHAYASATMKIFLTMK